MTNARPALHFTPSVTFALAALAIAAFAGNSLLTRAALSGELIGPGAFGTIRLASGAAALMVFCLLTRRDIRPRITDLPGAAALAVYTGFFSFAYVALDAASGALILFAAVGGTVTIASLRHGVSAREIGGLMIAFAGLVWLLLPGSGGAAPGAAALMAVAGVAWGVYTLRGRAGGDPVGRTARNFALAWPFLLPAMLITGFDDVTGHGITLAIVCGVITSAAGYSVWYLCLPRLPVIASGSVQLATPAAAALGGVLLLGEPAGWRLAGASALILAGIALTLIRRRQAGSITPKA
ncbi:MULTISPECIES: DMT family transporter [Hyphobacterium]|uniref:DMT family transporter n=1 Tax=Hyphobacterium vulgare TaxID=1736751 RepID=A0ABV6ZZ61_9PROT